MAMAGGLFARSHGARDSGASDYVCARRARLAGTAYDSIFLSRGAARLPRVDDARVVVGFRPCFGALLCIDSTAVEPLTTGCRSGYRVWIPASDD